MEKIIVKRKEFEVIQSLGEQDAIVSFKNKNYLLKRCGDDSEAFDDLLYNLKRLYISGIPCYKIFRVDKKTHDIVLTYQPGDSIYSLLLKGPLDEKVFDELFKVNYIARQNKCFLDYSPKMWNYFDGKLFYLGTKFEPLTEKNKDYLVDIGIKYWYHTTVFKEFARENGNSVDKKFFKTEFETNKELLLLACKYYR